MKIGVGKLLSSHNQHDYSFAAELGKQNANIVFGQLIVKCLALRREMRASVSTRKRKEVAAITSRKCCEKKPQSFSHCGSFDHPDLQSLNNCKLFFLFHDSSFKLFGACNTPLERCFQDLSSGILKAPKFLKFELVNK
jgi:hypothetical protein